jgi:hypothetical protein
MIALAPVAANAGSWEKAETGESRDGRKQICEPTFSRLMRGA